MDNESIVICRELRDDVERRTSRVADVGTKDKSERLISIGELEKEQKERLTSKASAKPSSNESQTFLHCVAIVGSRE